jgi:DNA mismatch endonuclease (patch repair protein)
MKTPSRRMSPEMRHRVMASIRKVDTVPEKRLRCALWSAGVRGWRCYVRMTGTPDVVFLRWKVAVFVDGVWWHGHPAYLPNGRRGPYWDEKIAHNKAHDQKINALLSESGWLVVRLWDIDILSEPAQAVAAVTSALSARGWKVP